MGITAQIYNVSKKFTFFSLRRQLVKLAKLMLLGFVLSMLTVSVYAHDGDVFLSRSNPAINTVIPQSPSVIHLWFEDPLVPEFSRFQLRDINTRLIETTFSQISADDPKALFMRLENDLPDGLYTVTYQVISAADGHEGVGSFAFIVGQVSDSQGNLLIYNEALSSTHTGVRGLHILALTIILGGGFYTGLKVETGRHINRAVRLGWILYGFAQVALLWMHITTLIVPGDDRFGELVFRYLTSTWFGLVWCMTIIVWLVMGLLIVRGAPARVIVGCGTVLAGFASLTGRVMAAPETFAAIAVYWLHIVSSGLWLGGLLFMVFDQIITRRTDSGIGQKFIQFTVIALPVAGLTGLYNSWLRVGTLEALTDTGYGQALMIKVLLGMALLAVFTYSVRPGGLMRLVRVFQIVLGLAVLAVTGVMLTLTPGRQIIALRNAIPPTLEYQTTIQELLTVDGLHLQLYVTPGVTGTNRLDVLVFESTTGIRLDDVSRLMLDLTSPQGEVFQVQLVFEGDGLYTAESVEMNAAERWDVRMTVARPSQQDVIAAFTVEILPPLSSSAPVVDRISPASERLMIAAMTGILLSLTGSLVLLSFPVGRVNHSQHALRKRLTVVGLSFVLFSGLFIHPVIYIICGGLLIAWMGLAAGSVGGKAVRSGNWNMLFAIASVTVGGILLISAGFIPLAVP